MKLKHKHHKKKQQELITTETPKAIPTTLRNNCTYRPTPLCHKIATEIIPNLFVGGYKEVDTMISHGAEVLVPLDSLEGDIWKKGFRGEILYYPVPDYGVLPNDVAAKIVSEINDRLSQGKKVGIFCIGGHGRTGYVVSLVLGTRGIIDPVAYLRETYCPSAVESTEQIKAIAETLKNPEILKHKTTISKFAYGYYDLDWRL